MTLSSTIGFSRPFSSPLHSISSIFNSISSEEAYCVPAFKSKVQFRQIVIHIRVLSIKFNNSAVKFVNCHWNSSLSLSELRMQAMQGSNSSFFQTNSLFCHSNSSGVIEPLHLGDDFGLRLGRKWMPIDEIAFAVSCLATVTDEFELQLTKTGDKARNWMAMFSKLIYQRRNWNEPFAHSSVVRDEIENTFSKIEWRDDENGRENL